MKKITTVLFLLCFSLVSTSSFAQTKNPDEEFHQGKRYQDILVHVSSKLTDKTSLAYLKRYQVRDRIRQRIRAHLDGQRSKSPSLITLTVTITDFRFRTGDFLGKGADSRDNLEADVLVEGSLKESKTFSVRSSLAKGLTRGSRVKRLVDELASQLVSSLP